MLFVLYTTFFPYLLPEENGRLLQHLAEPGVDRADRDQLLGRQCDATVRQGNAHDQECERRGDCGHRFRQHQHDRVHQSVAIALHRLL